MVEVDKNNRWAVHFVSEVANQVFCVARINRYVLRIYVRACTNTEFVVHTAG